MEIMLDNYEEIEVPFKSLEHTVLSRRGLIHIEEAVNRKILGLWLPKFIVILKRY